MSYSPNNVNTFVAAMSGALSGIGIGERPITSTTSADYSKLAQCAFAYAEEFDTLWAASGLDTLEWGAILTASCNYWENRSKLSLVPTDYEAECAAIIAAIKEGDAYTVTQGITPPAWPPGGSNGTLAYVWKDNGEVINATVAGTEQGFNITPKVTGLLTVRITGVAQSNDTGTTHTLQLALTGTDGLDYVMGTPIDVTRQTSANPGSSPFSLVVALDKLNPPVIPALNAVYTVDVNFIADADNHVSIAADSVQVEIQERPS